MMWVETSGQFKGRDGFSGRVSVFDNEALLPVERLFSFEVECLYGNLLFASSVLKVDCKGSVYENIWNMSPKELDTCIKLIELFKTLA